MRLALPLATLVACHPMVFQPGPSVGGLDTPGPCQDPTTWFEDVDGDGYGVEDSTFETCGVPEAGWSLRLGDCDDADDGIYPGAIETCDGVDRDCSGVVGDHAVDQPEWAVDMDGDGARDPALGVFEACEAGPHGVDTTAPDDCDDTDPAIHPGAPDPTCDGIDQSCSGTVDVAYTGERRFSDINLALREARRTLFVCPGEHRVIEQPRSVPSVDIRGQGEEPEDTVLVGAGGRILDVDTDRLSLNNLTLQHGRTEGDGGAVRVRAARVHLDRVRVRDGRATGDGGAFAMDLVDWTKEEAVVFSSVQIFDAHAGGSGGAVRILRRDETDMELRIGVRDSHFERTTAGEDGGGLSIEDHGPKWASVRIERSVFREVRAGGAGGGVHMTGPNAWIRLEDSDLQQGAAARGGLISVESEGDAASIDVRQSVLRHGAAEEGGLLHARGPTAAVSAQSSVLDDGEASAGGLIHVRGAGTRARVTLQDSTVTRGQADRGAAVLLTGTVSESSGVYLSGGTVSDQRDDVAIRVDLDAADAERSPYFSMRTFYSAPSAVLRNRDGGISVPSGTVVTMTEADLGTGPDDNGTFDLQIGSRTFSWDDPVTATCSDTGCEEE